MDQLVYDVWLNNIKGIGPYLIHSLLKELGSAEDIYHASKVELMNVHKIGDKTAVLLLEHRNLDYAKSIIQFCQSSHITLVTHTHPYYPRNLLLYNEAPLLLYIKGNLAPLNHLTSAAIIGSRRCSEYGKKATKELVTILSDQNTCVISGMAKGIDSYAHTYALKNQGYTLAVLGTGVERCYPSEHASLMEAMIDRGAVISQFPPKTPIHKQYFLKRNELIAMLCDQLYVMQASMSSGALYTAECALKYKKPVYALPGTIYDELSMGCHALIEKGALIYSKAPTLSNSHSTISSTSNSSLPIAYTKVLNSLCDGPLCIDELCATLCMKKEILEEIIFELEIQDHLTQIGGVIKLNT